MTKRQRPKAKQKRTNKRPAVEKAKRADKQPAVEKVKRTPRDKRPIAEQVKEAIASLFEERAS